ncbi:replication-associated recombination protein A [Bacillus sp. ISL-35]|uniref:replication-associated recombination protein A n=1 Tax=Bacillus sp. ISL-35 TaxID=2819122 RepID=UPI001BECD0E6|nr:replication-associated recombination protein A [Bacillus sp. ISL-35]MBT2677359.1 replication-associated recombination protein A [Bacillus sp. ISL-35]MBT2702254.1 replication-associated recombination protein A [Chryseobacterium sp. ISL-80]
MRPQNIDEVVGQKHIIGKETALYKMIINGHVPSILLYGPPGVGKTSIARAIAGTVNRPFVSINATIAGKKDIENAVEEAKIEGNLILFIDEVHRFNKAQQDYLLPHVEKGLITLIGATTENPFHDVNPAIRSRCGQIKELKPLLKEDIKELLMRALSDKERGFGKEKIQITKDSIDLICSSTNGDARSALNVLEEVIIASKDDKANCITVEKEIVKECVQNKGFTHDKDGDLHYSLLSCLQKSIRGSDVNSALHYLARLIEGGDLISICRRLLVIAYEDISIAAPEIGFRTLAAIQAVERLGLPEGRIPLANIVVEQCLSPKTNSAYTALDLALEDVRNGNVGEIPIHLKDAHYSGAKILGHGSGYKYPHDYPNSWVNQQYLPESLKDKKYYQPKQNGYEKHYSQVYEKLNGLKNNLNNQ